MSLVSTPFLSASAYIRSLVPSSNAIASTYTSVPLIAVSEPAPSSAMRISTAETSAFPLYHLIDGDDEPLPDEEDLMHHNRRAVNVVGERSTTINMGDSDFILREIATMHIRESSEASTRPFV